MNAVERYIRQATRGLNGQARRDARAELRGAIEDKVWRFTLLGLSEGDAARAALRDLGSPHAIASGLTRVHTLPKAALAAVLAATATLLGVQALAQVPVVQAIPDPTLKICTFDETSLNQIRPIEYVAKLRLQLALPGGRAKLEAECRAHTPAPPNSLLRFSDLASAFRAGGVQVRTLEPLDGFFYLTFPGRPEQTIDLSGAAQKINGQTYISAWSLIPYLRFIPDISVRLTGTVNPVLEMGPAKLQLGTVKAPVLATDLYATLLYELVGSLLSSESGTVMPVASVSDDAESKRNFIEVSSTPGAMFVTVSNESLVHRFQANDPRYLFRVLSVKNGVLPAPELFGDTGKARIVNSPKDLLRATAAKKPALLVYKLDASDLRFLKLTPVLASAFTVLPAR